MPSSNLLQNQKTEMSKEESTKRLKDAKALHAIKISCGTEIFSFIREVNTAKDAWEVLEKKFKLRDILRLEKKEREEKERSLRHAKDAGTSVSTDEDSKIKASEGGNEKKADYEFDSSYQPFFDHVETGDWNKAKECLAKLHRNALKAKHPKTGYTALHAAVMKGHVDIVKELLSSMEDEDLVEIKDSKGYTALDAVVFASVAEEDLIQMATYMVENNKKILETGCPPHNYIPLVKACSWSKWELARYLSSVTPLEAVLQGNGIQGANLINMCIRRPKGLHIASHFLRKCRSLAITDDGFGNPPMLVLAGMRCAYLSGAQLTSWKRWINKSIHIRPVDFNILDTYISVSKSGDDQEHDTYIYALLPAFGMVFAESVRASLPLSTVVHFGTDCRQFGVDFGMSLFRTLIEGVLQFLGINDIYEMKSIHVQVKEILGCMGEETTNMDNYTLAEHNVVRNSIFKAIEKGHVDFITHMCEKNKALVDILDEKGKNIFQYAIECRQEEIYSLIYGVKPEEKRERIRHNVAKFNNNMLHSAANLSPLPRFNHIQGASLQMQRELQWFQEVENTLPSEMNEYVNSSDGLTARELFTKNHTKLKEEAEISIKGTATSCTTVGTLIVTIMFAVAFTVPGGTNGNTGLPMFMHKKLFRIFIVSDTISLVFSATSVITFLGMLTSRYAENDFLLSLPTKMMIGLSTLFISIAAMMITFSCALAIMFDGEAKMIITGIVFASVPVGSFVLFLFPLLFEICRSTYGPSMFRKKAGIKL